MDVFEALQQEMQVNEALKKEIQQTHFIVLNHNVNNIEVSRSLEYLDYKLTIS
jgi:hypothetical protein